MLTVSKCLALPRGSVHHFRYLERYVDDAIRQQLANTPGQLQSSLRDLSVVVVYLYQEQTGGAWKPAPSDNDEGAYIPLRCGRLLDAFLDGEIAHFYFELTDYIKPQHDDLTARAYLNAKVLFRLSADEKADVSYAHMGVDLHTWRSYMERYSGFNVSLAAPTSQASGKQEPWQCPLDVVYDVVFVRVGGVFRRARPSASAPLEDTPRPLIGNPSAEYVCRPGRHPADPSRYSPGSEIPAEVPGQGSATLSLRFDHRCQASEHNPFPIPLPDDLHYWSIVPRQK